MFTSTKLKKIKWFYLFLTYLFLFVRGGKYSPMRIHQKIFNDLYYLKLFEKETRNWINPFLNVLVMFLYLRNRKFVTNFIYWLLLFDENYSNNNTFLFYNFFSQTLKSLSKTFYLWEIENVVWECKI